ncbi:MAG: hypothetical protein D6683_14880 [Actinomyces sp.]|nr:MAG: hypothetical protein D6683_14880 [Actinomyces sp.]
MQRLPTGTVTSTRWERTMEEHDRGAHDGRGDADSDEVLRWELAGDRYRRLLMEGESEIDAAVGALIWGASFELPDPVLPPWDEDKMCREAERAAEEERRERELAEAMKELEMFSAEVIEFPDLEDVSFLVDDDDETAP